MVHQLLIIGAGPAGYTAGLYAARANLQPVLFEGPTPGGQLTTTTEVENFPGFPAGLQGAELMQRMREQAAHYGTTLVSDLITRVDFESYPFRLWDSRDQLHEAQAVIVATGAKALYLGLPSEEALMGRGVSACATCDGFFFRGKDVVVVGGGDTALEETIYLSHLARHVTLIHRRDELRGSRIMQERARALPNVTLALSEVVEEVLGTEHVTGVRLRHVSTHARRDLATDGLFVAIGHQPATAMFAEQLALDAKGYLATHDGTHTSVPGVFAAGDVQDAIYRQAITAAGSGCMAAIDAERWLAARPPAPVPATV